MLKYIIINKIDFLHFLHNSKKKKTFTINRQNCILYSEMEFELKHVNKGVANSK